MGAVLGWALLIAALAIAGRRLFLGYPVPTRRPRRLSSREVSFLQSAAEAMFPPGGAIPLGGADADLPGYVDRYFELLAGSKRLQMRLLFALVEQATLLFPAPGRGGFGRFSALSANQREAVLRGWSESRLPLRRLVFTALRAVLTMGYLGHPATLRHIGLAPYDLPRPVVEADLLIPRVGAHPDSIPWSEADLSPPADPGSPIPLDAPLHPDFAERPL